MMSPGMMNQGMGQMGMGSQMGSMGHGGQGSYMQGAEVSVMGSNASKMNGNGKQKQIYDFEDDHSSGYSAGEEETNEELRRLRGMEKLSAKEKKKTKEEAKEEAMFKKNKGALFILARFRGNATGMPNNRLNGTLETLRDQCRSIVVTK